MAIPHRKNSLFYKSDQGAHMGDIYMSLIHTCDLNGVHAFDYLGTTARASPARRQADRRTSRPACCGLRGAWESTGASATAGGA